MGADLPKQYLPLCGQPLIRHPVATLAAVPAIARVFVVLSPGDREWDRHDWRDLSDRLVVLRCGGATRAASVGFRRPVKWCVPGSRLVLGTISCA